MFVDIFIECVVLLDLTDELDVFCPSFVTQNSSASLYSILTYQIIFPPPHPGYSIFNFSLKISVNFWFTVEQLSRMEYYVLLTL